MHDVDRQFWALIEGHWESLWRFSLGLTSDREEAADLMSDAVLAAHKSFGSLRSQDAFKSFLFTIAHRLHKRKSWRHKIFGKIEEAEREGYEHSRESSYDLDLLLEALHKLPEKQREAILLFEISGFSLEEIRVIQGGSLSAVKLRLYRGRDALRQLLSDDMPMRTLNNKSLLVPTSIL